MSFINTLASRHASLGHQICVGIDPPIDGQVAAGLSFFSQAWKKDRVRFVEKFASAAIDAAQGHAAMVKFQSAFFEAYGHEGWRILQEQMGRAKDLGLIVLWDAKRGDISTTMRAYGETAFETLGADALTVTPYMGTDVFSPLEPWLQQGKGVYVVWTTSNPGAAVFQDAKISSEQTLTDLVFAQSQRWFRERKLETSLGFVLGVTRFDQLSEAVRPELTKCAVLMPGIGPQGGQVTPELQAFTRSCAACTIPMSRGLTGLGDPTQVEGMRAITSWDSFRDYIRKRISLASSQCPC